jgi:hypothetical protein
LEIASQPLQNDSVKFKSIAEKIPVIVPGFIEYLAFLRKQFGTNPYNAEMHSSPTAARILLDDIEHDFMTGGFSLSFFRGLYDDEYAATGLGDGRS